MASLGLSGLGLYFVPKYSKRDIVNDDVIYREWESNAPEKFHNLEDNRSKILQLLETMNSNFVKVVNELKTQKGRNHDLMIENYQEIIKEEEKLREDYERSKRWLEQIGKIIKGIFGASKRKLELDAVISELDYLNQSLAKMYESFRTWGFTLEQFICAIDNQDQTKKCDEKELKDWLTITRNDISSSIISPKQPGGALNFRKKRFNS